ncbi:MAG: hypothetical protein ABH821_06355 [archaeon]
MFSLDVLRFAQRYPFSGTARQVVLQSNFSLEQVSDSVLKRSALMVLSAVQGKQYELSHVTQSSDVLLNEVLAFPTAKALLSVLSNPSVNSSFSVMVSKNAFDLLEQEELKTLTLIASDLNLSFEIENSLFKVQLKEFLKHSFSFNFMKLINLKLEKGFVFLNMNEFIRLLSAIVREQTFKTIQSNLKNAPKTFIELGKQLEKEIQSLHEKELTKPFTGKRFKSISIPFTVNFQAFPPCISLLYTQLTSGNKLPHIANFDLAVFLHALRFDENKMVDVYRNSPNFKENIARYQVKKIKEKNYSSPSCKKVIEHELCRKHELCNGIFSPLQYYLKQYQQLKNTKQEKSTA